MSMTRTIRLIVCCAVCLCAATAMYADTHYDIVNVSASWVPCQVCGGSARCVSCAGSGWVYNPYTYQYYLCAVCNGFGSCGVCRGTGFQYVYIPVPVPSLHFHSGYYGWGCAVCGGQYQLRYWQPGWWSRR